MLYAGIGPGTRPLSRTVPYKAYMGPSVGDLFFRTLEELDETLAHYRGHKKDEEAALEARNGRIGPEHFPEQMRRTPEGGPLTSLRDVEMRHIERVLQEARGNQRRASRILGISRWSLSRRLRKYGMQPRVEE